MFFRRTCITSIDFFNGNYWYFDIILVETYVYFLFLRPSTLKKQTGKDPKKQKKARQTTELYIRARACVCVDVAQTGIGWLGGWIQTLEEKRKRQKVWENKHPHAHKYATISEGPKPNGPRVELGRFNSLSTRLNLSHFPLPILIFFPSIHRPSFRSSRHRNALGLIRPRLSSRFSVWSRIRKLRLSGLQFGILGFFCSI